MFTNFLLKRTNYIGDIKKYQFNLYVIPGGISSAIMAIYTLSTMFVIKTSYEEPLKYLLFNSFNLLLTITASLVSAYVCAVLLKTAITEDETEKYKRLRKMAICVTISAIISIAIYIIIYAINESFTVWAIITDIIVYGLYIVIAWCMTIFKCKNEKLTYIILPFISISNSLIFSIIGTFIN